jgi:hypothetical protein
MKISEWIRKSMEETPGVPSSVRLQLLVITAAVVVVFVGLALSVALGKLPDIPAGVVSFGTLLFSGAAAAKVIQQRSE